MGRPGITYDDVSFVATQLKEQNKNPTIESIRAYLGTGSSSTINFHLRKWKDALINSQNIPSKENLPEELVFSLKSVWDKVLNHANERIASLEQNHQDEQNALKDELAKYRTNNQRWQQLYQQWIDEKAKLQEENKQLQTAQNQSKEDISALLSKYNALLQESQEKDKRINELHQLHKQVQANLEHYREASREQRLLDQEQFEQQKRELLSSQKSLKEEINREKDKMTALEQQCLQLQQVQLNLETRRAEVLAQYEILRQQFIESEQDKMEQLIDLEVKNKLLTQQLDSAQESLESIKQQNQQLVREQAHLSTKNVDLEEELKQMQIMTVQQMYRNAKKVEEF